MMNQGNGWMNGWMGGQSLVWIAGCLLIVVLLFILIGRLFRK